LLLERKSERIKKIGDKVEIKKSHFMITGSNRGIGRAVALMAAADGAHLYLVNRTADDELESECLRLGAASCHQFHVDLGIKENINLFTKEIQDLPLEILFNNAGQLTGGLLEEQSVDEIYSMLQVNVNALIHLSHFVVKGMLERRRGKIINNSSVSGVMNLPCASTYSASKAAVVAFSQCLQTELGGTGVGVMLLLTPGVDTRMFTEIGHKYGKNFDLSFLGQAMSAKEYAQRIREAIIEDLDILKPQGFTGLGLMLAQHVPTLFNKLVGKKFQR
jgi:short-subunit dehydrogenase